MIDKTSIKCVARGELIIGHYTVPCFVLEDETRLISARNVGELLGFTTSLSVGEYKKKVEVATIKALRNDDILVYLNNYSLFKNHTNSNTHGYEGETFINICNELLKLRRSGAFRTKGLKQATALAETYVSACAIVGIVALIDEATGYDKIRKRGDLHRILNATIRNKELAELAKRFPDIFYMETFRLRGWKYDPATVKRPSIIGKWTCDFVYARMVEYDINKPLKEFVKSIKKDARLHQGLTDETGLPALDRHLYAVIAIMRHCQNWRQFETAMARSFPKKGHIEDMLADIE